MKITRRKLRQIINEEKNKLFREMSHHGDHSQSIEIFDGEWHPPGTSFEEVKRRHERSEDNPYALLNPYNDAKVVGKGPYYYMCPFAAEIRETCEFHACQSKEECEHLYDQAAQDI